MVHLKKYWLALVIWAANQEAHKLVCWDDFCNWAWWAFRLLGNKSYKHSVEKKWNRMGLFFFSFPFFFFFLILFFWGKSIMIFFFFFNVKYYKSRCRGWYLVRRVHVPNVSLIYGSHTLTLGACAHLIQDFFPRYRQHYMRL